jgi:hypothetical protein
VIVAGAAIDERAQDRSGDRYVGIDPVGLKAVEVDLVAAQRDVDDLIGEILDSDAAAGTKVDLKLDLVR